jgi:hypothetical protein
MIANGEVRMMWTKAVLVRFKVHCYHSHVGTEEGHDNPSYDSRSAGPRIEPEASRLWIKFSVAIQFWSSAFTHYYNYRGSWSAAGIAQRYSAKLRAGWSVVRIPAGTANFSLHHRVQTGSGAHPASCSVDTRGSFPVSKATGTWGWPLTSTYCRGQCVELYLHYPNTPSWRGAQGQLYLLPLP